MLIKATFAIVIIAGATFPLATAQKLGPNPTARDADRWSDAEITTWMYSNLNRGLPDELGDYTAVASHARSSIVVPLTEKKIEEVLKSNSPRTCFSDPTVDPAKFVREAVGVIRGAGDENALKAASKLIGIDEQRFGWIVGNILYNAMGRRNPFSVAYQGLGIGDPAIDSRIAEWAEAELSGNVKSTQQEWAAAMLDKYSVVPNANQWQADPIALRLSAKTLELVQSNVTRLAAIQLETHPNRLLKKH